MSIKKSNEEILFVKNYTRIVFAKNFYLQFVDFSNKLIKKKIKIKKTKRKKNIHIFRFNYHYFEFQQKQ